MLDLEEIIKNKILKLGSISLMEFLTLVLYHHEKGYYSKSNIIGKKGDFITAPEVSQVFGEMIANFIALNAKKIVKYKDLCLTELGPGRGTLMKDILRTLKKIDEKLYQKLQDVYFLEQTKAFKNVLEKKEQSQTVLDTYRAARQRLMDEAEKERAELLESVRNFSESEQKYKDYWNYPEKHEENMRQLIDKQKTSQLTGVVFDEELFGKMYNFYWGNDDEAKQRRRILNLYLRLGNDSIFLLKDRNNKVTTDAGIKQNKTFKQLTNAQQKELLANCEQWYDVNVISGGESKESQKSRLNKALQYIYTRMVRIVKIEAILKEETTMPMPGLEPKEYPLTDNSVNKSKYRIKLREATNDELKIILTDLKDKAQGEGVPRSVYRNYNNFADPDLALMQQDLAYGSRGYKAAEVSE